MSITNMIIPATWGRASQKKPTNWQKEIPLYRLRNLTKGKLKGYSTKNRNELLQFLHTRPEEANYLEIYGYSKKDLPKKVGKITTELHDDKYYFWGKFKNVDSYEEAVSYLPNDVIILHYTWLK
jgi:hypothetical protein